MSDELKLEDIIRLYAAKNGAFEVWRSWRDTMIDQDREVAPKFMQLPIPVRDMELDAQIAFDVVKDYLVWRSHELNIPDEDVLTAEVARLQGLVDEAEEVVYKISSWAKAYPLSVFPEPDFEKAAQILRAGGMSLDVISASNMRHVIEGVKEYADAALAKLGEK